MGPLTIIYLLHNFHNSNSWIIRFFCGGPFSLELGKFDCIFSGLGKFRDDKDIPYCFGVLSCTSMNL